MDEDQELVALAKLGKLDAFEALVRKYEVRIRGYCSHILSDLTAAEDAAQEVFFKAFRNLSTFRGESLFSTWLYRISVNHCRDQLRQQKRRPQSQLDDEDSIDRPASIELQTPAIENTVEQRDLLLKLLNRLPNDYREVLLLREGHDLSYEQIATALGCSLDAVKARIRRARAELLDQARHLLDDDNVSFGEGKIGS